MEGDEGGWANVAHDRDSLSEDDVDRPDSGDSPSEARGGSRGTDLEYVRPRGSKRVDGCFNGKKGIELFVAWYSMSLVL